MHPFWATPALSLEAATEVHSPFFQCICLLFEGCAFWGLSGGQRIFISHSKDCLFMPSSHSEQGFLLLGICMCWWLLASAITGSPPHSHSSLSLQQGLLHRFCWLHLLLPPLTHVLHSRLFFASGFCYRRILWVSPKSHSVWFPRGELHLGQTPPYSSRNQERLF